MQRKSKPTKTGVCLALIPLLGGFAASSQGGDTEQAQEYRQGLMNVFRWNMKAMSDMMKGKTPYDAAAFSRHADDLAKAAGLDLLAGFPEDSDTGETDARPEIWLNFEDFTQKLHDLRKASQALKETSAAGDKTAIGDAVGKVGKACKACHDNYKD